MKYYPRESVPSMLVGWPFSVFWCFVLVRFLFCAFCVYVDFVKKGFQNPQYFRGLDQNQNLWLQLRFSEENDPSPVSCISTCRCFYGGPGSSLIFKVNFSNSPVIDPVEESTFPRHKTFEKIFVQWGNEKVFLFPTSLTNFRPTKIENILSLEREFTYIFSRHKIVDKFSSNENREYFITRKRIYIYLFPTQNHWQIFRATKIENIL